MLRSFFSSPSLLVSGPRTRTKPLGPGPIGFGPWIPGREYTFAFACNRIRPKSKLLYSIVQNQPGECEVALFAAQFKV